jgi:hypothetical protein
MIRRIDQWIGTRLFHPPIIWLCQWTGITQYAVARYGWMLAAWTLVMRISFEGFGNRVFSLLIIVVTFLETWRAAMMPDAPTHRTDAFRLIILIFAVFDIMRLAVVTSQAGFPGFNWNHAWDLFALIAEYAKTIQTIPPRKASDRRALKVRQEV